MIPSPFRPVVPAFLASALLAAPRVAQACAVCTGGQNDQVNRALLVGSIFLSVIPLAALGTAVWWLRRRARALSDRPTGRVAPSNRPAPAPLLQP